MSHGSPLGRECAVAGLESPNMGDEYPSSFLASPDDHGNIAQPRRLLGFENTYRGPSRVEANRQSGEWKPDARRCGLRSGVRLDRRYERPIYQDLIEVVPQKQGRGLGGKHVVSHIWRPTD